MDVIFKARSVRDDIGVVGGMLEQADGLGGGAFKHFAHAAFCA